MSDHAQTSVLEHLGRDHQRIEQVLRLIESEITRFDDDDNEVDLNAVAAALAYIKEYPDTIHHPVEERMFDALANKVSADTRTALTTLRAQHADITASTLKLAQAVDRVLQDIVTPVEIIYQHLRAYVDLQREHMQLEQTAVFPVAARVLEAADWCLLEQRLANELDPMFDQRRADFNVLYNRIVDTLVH